MLSRTLKEFFFTLFESVIWIIDFYSGKNTVITPVTSIKQLET